MTYGAVGRAQNYAETAGTAALSFRGGTTICYRGGLETESGRSSTTNRFTPPAIVVLDVLRRGCDAIAILSILNAFTFDLTSHDTSSPILVILQLSIIVFVVQ